ncbi:nuclear transport factor 2 family protein [Actinomyces sp.]|uniref:nuclear transport factor 2 family protein n=1 Tax=Actinomyces sp. TaxID=29317 RepID=UPI0026DD549D|nr:polyketide cyclase [Actinomyces sp.]MDO4900722.1 polyketide cyclase [Actinomyces sp.]
MEASSGREPESILADFFAAENARDWRAYVEFLHPGVEWTLIDGSRERTIAGREPYLRAIKSAYAEATTTFRCLETIGDRRGGLIAAVLVNDAGERSVDVFLVEGRLIRREWEFLLGRP